MRNSKGPMPLGRPEVLGAKIAWPCSDWMEELLEVLSRRIFIFAGVSHRL